MHAIALAASPSPHSSVHLGGGVLILAVLVIAALAYGATRITRGRHSAGQQEPPWPSGRPAPPPAGAPSAGPPPEERITAPAAGVPLFITSSPAVSADGLLLGLARPAQRP